METAPEIVATAKPSRTRRQPSARPMTPAQIQRHRDQIAREKTEKLEHQMYTRTVRQTRLALARQKGRADALKEAGIKPQEQQRLPAQSKQKPLAKAPKPIASLRTRNRPSADLPWTSVDISDLCPFLCPFASGH